MYKTKDFYYIFQKSSMEFHLKTYTTMIIHKCQSSFAKQVIFCARTLKFNLYDKC